MEDKEMVDLYWERSEDAIIQTAQKYQSYCIQIAYNILYNKEDSEECVNDAYLRVWNAIPPKRPECFSAFLGKITRNLAFNKYNQQTAKKRGAGQMEFVLHELEESILPNTNFEEEIDGAVLVKLLNHFLLELPKTERIIFVQRYWYVCSIKELSERWQMSESKIKSKLFRMRNKLKKYLKKEGVSL